MRISAEQQDLIREVVAAITEPSVRIYVFGSRLNDDARGGDLDLLLESEARVSLLQRARLKLALETRLAMPVDIVSMQRGAAQTAFQIIAHRQGVLL